MGSVSVLRCQFCIVDGSVHRKEVEDAERGARSRPTRWHSMHRKSLRGVLIARYERSPVAVIVLLCRLLLRHHTEFGSPAVCSFVSINSMLSITRLTPAAMLAVRSGPVRNGEVRNIQVGSGCIVRKMQFVVNDGVLIK